MLVGTLIAGGTVTKEQRCLAEAVHREASGEPYLGKLAVAQVVINRKNSGSFPNTICKVVFEKNQFSWTSSWKGRWKYNAESLGVAVSALEGDHVLENFEAMYFHNRAVKPRWAKKLTLVKKIKNHYFYA